MTLEEFQQESKKRKVGREKRGKPVPYDAAARSFAMAYAKRRTDSGGSLHGAAKILGVTAQTLRQWQDERKGTLRPVKIVESRQGQNEKATLITPRGFRVEGLDVETLTRLLREL